jgi:Zn-dependent peptidase ImmA (M78 family)
VRHGFKAQSERLSRAAREALGLKPIDPIQPEAYLRHLGLELLTVDALELSEVARRQLLVNDSESWSGMTIKMNRVIAIVVNPSHTPERQANTLMHEAAHVILRHIPKRVDVSKSGILIVSDYGPDDEAEADWLAGALLLPRDALRYHRSRGRTSTWIASHYGVSLQLSDWRIRMTGVDVQTRRARANASSL